ncbi:MAG TPA: hypothetical protein VN203_17175 [Candidatus Acidoferrum sp.]|nr:hypothetical protein [Candidatus Acidoferrum sp.]
MNLVDTSVESLDLMQLLEQMYEREQWFWRDIEQHVMHGAPAADEKGHWVEVRFRVRPSLIDLITAIKEKHPAGMYKSHADLLRSLLSTGCKVHFEFFKRKKSMQWGDLEEMLGWLNIIGREHRLRELKEDVRKAMKITMDGKGAPEEKIPMMEFLGKMEKKLDGLVASGKRGGGESEE